MRMICIGKIERVQVESSVMERLVREKNGIRKNEMEGAGEWTFAMACVVWCVI